jgi:hypothetical protein
MPKRLPNPNKVKCSGTNKAGQPCGRWADPHSDSGLCVTHADPELWHSWSVKGGRRNAIKAQRKKQAHPRASLDATIPPFKLYEILEAALRADFAAVGLPKEIDWSSRLLALLVLVQVAPDMFLDVATDPAFRAVYMLARATWDELKRRPGVLDRLTDLYVSEYPPAIEPAKR